MPTYHRSQRLRLVGTGPKVEQLQEGRFRLTFTCTATNPNEAWMNGNKDQIMTAYGTLQSAQKNIAGIDPRTDEAYSDMVLFRTEANPSERDLIITLVYETATTSFVKAQDDKIDFELNGLKRVTRVTIAKTGTTLPTATVGTTTLSQSETDIILASKSVEENDAFIQITEVYLEQGTVSESIDNVGSQLAKVITTFGANPSTPTNYVLASKEESNFAGYQTNTFRFLKEDVILSKSIDESRADKPEVIEYFKPVASRLQAYDENTNPGGVPDGKILDSKVESNVDGIPTERYTFRKDGAVLSQNWDRIGSQQAVVITKYNDDPDTNDVETFTGVTGLTYAIARKVKNGRERTFTFLETNSILSVSEDKVGSQKAIVNEIFYPTDEDGNTAGLQITGKDADGEDLSGYSEADRTISDFEGIQTVRVRFLKNNCILSTSKDNIGSQQAVVIEKFGSAEPANTETINSINLTGYGLAKKEESNVDGIKTFRYTFLNPSILSVEESKNTPENRITVRVFGLASDDSSVSAASGAVVDTGTHILVSQSEQDYEGVKTSVYVFESDDYCIKSINEFGRTVLDRVEQSTTAFTLQDQAIEYTVNSVTNLRILNQTIQNDDNDVNKRITKFSTVGIDDVKEDIVGSQKAIVITKVGSEPTTTEAASKSDIAYDAAEDWSIAKKDNAREGGLDVYTYTFLLNNTILSESQDKKGSLRTNVIEVFNPKVTVPGIRVEGGSNIAGDYFLNATQVFGKNYYTQKTGQFYEKAISYNTFTSTWTFNLVSNTYSSSTDVNPDNSDDPPTTGWSGQMDSELFNMTFRDFDKTLPSSTSGVSTSHRYEKEGYSLINLQKSAVDGIPTMRYTFAKDNSVISVTEDKVGAQNAIVNEIFNPSSETITGVDSDNNALVGYSEADRTESDYEGIKTIRVRFLKNDSILSISEDFVGSQRAIVNEVFNPHQDGVSGKDTNNQALSGYSEADRTESNYNGIKTIRVRFLKDAVVLSKTEDLLGSQKGIVREVFNPAGGTEPAPLGGFILVNKQESNVNGIPTIRFSYLKQNTVLSVSEDKVGSQLAIVNEIFDPTGSISGQDASGTALSGYSEADRAVSQVDGIETVRVRFLKDDVILSSSVDLGSASKTVQIEKFGNTAPTNNEANTVAGTSNETYTIVAKKSSNTGGIPTNTFTFVNTNEGRLISAKRVFEDEFTLKPAYELSSETKTPDEIATDLAAAATSGDTVDLTPNITIPIDTSTDQHHTLFLDTNEDLTSVPKKFSQILINIDTEGGTGDSLTDGILVNKYQSHEVFNYPGEIDIKESQYGDANDISYYSNIKQVPITATIEATVYEFIQNSPTIASTDYTLDPEGTGAASGLWRPNNWGNYHVSIIGPTTSIFEENKQWKGYRVVTPSFRRKVSGYYTNVRWEGNQYIYSGRTGQLIFTSNVGPPSPVGSKWTLDTDIKPIGLSAGGTALYKKTVVITEAIPKQKQNQLPY